MKSADTAWQSLGVQMNTQVFAMSIACFQRSLSLIPRIQSMHFTTGASIVVMIEFRASNTCSATWYWGGVQSIVSKLDVSTEEVLNAFYIAFFYQFYLFLFHVREPTYSMIGFFVIGSESPYKLACSVFEEFYTSRIHSEIDSCFWTYNCFSSKLHRCIVSLGHYNLLWENANKNPLHD